MKIRKIIKHAKGIAIVFCGASFAMLFVIGLVLPPLLFQYLGIHVSPIPFFGWVFWMFFYIGIIFYIAEQY